MNNNKNITKLTWTFLLTLRHSKEEMKRYEQQDEASLEDHDSLKRYKNAFENYVVLFCASLTLQLSSDSRIDKASTVHKHIMSSDAEAVQCGSRQQRPQPQRADVSARARAK